MATKKPQAKAQKPAPILTHEFGPNGEHRITKTEADKPVERGDWASYRTVAQLGDLRAASEYYAGTLPKGVFRCISVAHVV